eukprot:11172746-Lingulodinium_polyedra.AAC.1
METTGLNRIKPTGMKPQSMECNSMVYTELNHMGRNTVDPNGILRDGMQPVGINEMEYNTT